MKKILIISQNFYPEIGSAGNRMKNIYSLLKERGFNVNVLTADPTYPNRDFYKEDFFWDEPELNNDNDIDRVKMKKKRYSRKISNRIFYYLEMARKMFFYVIKDNNKYDVVLTTSPAIFVAMVGLFAKFRYKAKFVLEIRDLWPESLKGVGVFAFPPIIGVFRLVEKLLYSQASNIIVNSSGFIEYISSQSEKFKRKITYIPNGAREKDITYNKQAKNEFKVIYAGNMGLAQDEHILKELVKELNKKNIKLTIISYGLSHENLSGYIRENQYKNVTFIKPTTRKECFKIISEHQVGIVTLVNKDIFKTVLPGRVIDYMTCGVPIVASVSGLSKEVISNQNVGFVSENQEVQELMGHVDTLRNDIELQQEMGNNGRKYVSNHFLWEKNIDLLVNILNN